MTINKVGIGAYSNSGYTQRYENQRRPLLSDKLPVQEIASRQSDSKPTMLADIGRQLGKLKERGQNVIDIVVPGRKKSPIPNPIDAVKDPIKNIGKWGQGLIDKGRGKKDSAAARYFDEKNKKIGGAIRLAVEDSSKLTQEVLTEISELERKAMKSALKPLTKNVPELEFLNEIVDSAVNVQLISYVFAAKGLDPENVYKTEMYKQLYDGIKVETMKKVRSVVKLQNEALGEIGEEVLAHVSSDLAGFVEKLTEYTDKGVDMADVVTSFENVTTTILVYVGTQVGGHAGSALANTLAQRFIYKREMSEKEMLKSFAIGLATGYAGKHAGVLSGKQQLQAMASNVTREVVSGMANRQLNDTSYTSRDFIASAVSTSIAAGVQISSGIDSGTYGGDIIDAVSGVATGAIVHDEDVDGGTFSEAMMQAVIEKAVNDQLQVVGQAISDKIPAEYKALDDKLIAKFVGFFKGILDITGSIENIQIKGLEAVFSGMSDQEKAAFTNIYKLMVNDARDNAAYESFGKAYSELSSEELESEVFSESLQNQIDMVGLKVASSYEFAPVIKRLESVYPSAKKTGRSPAGIVLGTFISGMVIYGIYSELKIEKVPGHEGDGITSSALPEAAFGVVGGLWKAGIHSFKTLKSAIIRRRVDFKAGSISLDNLEKVSSHMQNPLRNAAYTPKVLQDMRKGDLHGFPSQVDSFASYAEKSLIKDHSGKITSVKLLLRGKYKGKQGHFTWIIKTANGQENMVDHRMFEPMLIKMK